MGIWLIILLVLSVIFIIFATARLTLHPFLVLLFTAVLFGIFSGMSLTEIVDSITGGFGGTLGSIGIVIAAGTIIGTFLEKSGSAFKMAEATLKLTGEKRVPLAMAIIGYIVSIPVFCDSGFVILSPLNRAVTKRAKFSLAATGLALSLGLYATHTMVPPTPGPIAAAGILGADLGMVILIGLIVSVPAMLIGVLYANIMGKRIYIEPEPELSDAEIEERTKKAPSTFNSFMPIVVPIILILLKSISDFPTTPFGDGAIRSFFGFVGNPVIALLIGVLIAFTLPKKLDKKMLSSSGWVGEGLLNAASIILITGAGGAFGRVLQNSGIANVLGEGLATANLGIWLPFIVAAVIKSAQGSSTVAIITTASLMAPLMGSLGLTTPAAIALSVVAIGAGSMVVSHANDSYFWVVSQFSRMSVNQAYKLQTLGTLVEGVTAAVVIWIISLMIL